jgi:hypothetical protein
VIRQYVAEKFEKQYWEQNQQPTRFNGVDCQAIERAATLIGHHRQRWIVKHTIGICGVNHWKQRWSSFYTNKCARCHTEIETATHVWLCSAASSVNQWNVSMDKFEETMGNIGTDPRLQEAMVGGLNRWHQCLPPRQSELEAAAAQDEIGWQSFLEGRIALEWSRTQQQHFESTNSRRSTKAWAAAVVQAALDVAWAQWTHRNEVDLATNDNWSLQKARLEARVELDKGRNRLTNEGLRHWLSMRQRTAKQFANLSADYLRMWTAATVAARNTSSTYMDRMRQNISAFLHC